MPFGRVPFRFFQLTVLGAPLRSGAEIATSACLGQQLAAMTEVVAVDKSLWGKAPHLVHQDSLLHLHPLQEHQPLEH